MVRILEDETLAERLAELEAQLERLSEAKSYLNSHGKALTSLEQIVSALDADPEQFEALEAEYRQADYALQTLKGKVFALSDLIERRHYFAYADSVDLLNKSSELSEQLKAKLVQAEQARTKGRDGLKQAREQMNQYNQVLAALKSSHQAKQETVQEFKQELQEFGVNADEGAEERADQDNANLQKEVCKFFFMV